MTTVLDTTQTGTKSQVKPALTRKPEAVSVNGVAISREEIAKETQNHPASKPMEAWLAAAHALAVRELLLQEARRLDVPQPLAPARAVRDARELRNGTGTLRWTLRDEVYGPFSGTE